MLEEIKVLIGEKELNERISQIADEISKDYVGEEIILVCILKGAVYFAVELSKKINNNLIIMDFMKVSSYGARKRIKRKN